MTKYDSCIKHYHYGVDVIVSTHPVFSSPDLHRIKCIDLNERMYRCFNSLSGYRASLDSSHIYSPVVDIFPRILSPMVNCSYFIDRDSRRNKRWFREQIKMILSKKMFSDLFSDQPSLNTQENARKAQARFREIVLSNPWDYFVTFTFDRVRVDRYNLKGCVDLLNKWTKNYFRSNKGAYILVPELHEDGALHFHGFISTENRDEMIQRDTDKTNGFPAVKSYKSSDGKVITKPIFTCRSWKYGYSELVPFTSCDCLKEIRYLTSYLKVTGKVLPRWYYSGGFIIRSPMVSLYNSSEDQKKQFFSCCDIVLDVPDVKMSFAKKFFEFEHLDNF